MPLEAARVGKRDTKMKAATGLKMFMLPSELIELVGCQSETISDDLFRRFATVAQYADLQKIPSNQLRLQALHLCRHFVEWASEANHQELEDRYVGLGVDRQSQGVALSHLIGALHLTRDLMLDCVADLPSLRGRLAYAEFTQSLNEFFDRVICATIVGYERGIDQERRQLRVA
jgi:hypothetical protein